jgi:hypothetical protein
MSRIERRSTEIAFPVKWQKAKYENARLTPALRRGRLAWVERQLQTFRTGHLHNRLINLRWRLNNPEKLRERRRRHCARYPELIKLRAKNTQRRVKYAVFFHYSKGTMRCDCCGEKEFDFLSIDHMNRDGKPHRKAIGGPQALYPWLRRMNFPPGYRVLCFNCNLGAGFFGICPHRRTAAQKRAAIVPPPIRTSQSIKALLKSKK